MKTHQALFAALCLALFGCPAKNQNGGSVSVGPAADTAAALTQTSASEVALGTVSGAVADAEGVSTELASNQSRSKSRAFASAFELFTSKAHAAAMACPVLSNTTLAQCAAGKLTLSLAACQYERHNGTLAKPVWMGSKILDFGPTCPARMAEVTSIVRTVGSHTTRTAADGVVLNIDTTTPSGYDTQITPQVSGGTATIKSASGRALDIKGIHYVAQKSATDPTKLWDHSVSTAAPIAVTFEQDGSRLVSGVVVVEHNLAKFTARAELADVAYDFAKCGCLPISGSITTTLTGSRTGTETLDITSCGQAQYTNAQGAKAPLTLTHCL